MHFALPPKNTPHPPPYARTGRSLATRRRQQLELGGYLILGILTIYLFLHYIFASKSSPEVSVPLGTPTAVIVTVLDDGLMSSEYIQKIKANREDYASRHGYANFFTNTTTYVSSIAPSPKSWCLVPAMRHAMTLYSHTPYFFSLSPHGLIMNPSLSLHDHVLASERLESLMLKDIPVVPPDSVIHTFSHLKGDKVELILTQDAESLSHGSFLIKNGEWARFFLDVWNDPLYRGYNFQKAEGHALEHIVQWHPTILAKLALVPQQIMNSYPFTVDYAGREKTERMNGNGLYQEDDFVIRFAGCEQDQARNCETEMTPFYEKWWSEVHKADGNGMAQ